MAVDDESVGKRMTARTVARFEQDIQHMINELRGE